MTLQLPQVTHIYQNHNLDSTRWQHFQPRADDIVITTSIKSGTTWMQEIVRQLIFSGQESAPERDHVAVWDVSPWLEWRMIPCEAILERLNAQQHRRFIKSHLPLDGLPFFPQVKYIVVGRDARDVAMSLWNHYAEFTEGVFAGTNSIPGRVGEPFPLPQPDIYQFWQDWISRGWFDWEREGYPFWGNLHHTQTWWQYRHLPNILFVHYADLKADLAGEIRRIADFLTIPLAADALPPILQAVTLEAMREREGQLNEGMGMSWKEGAKTFFFKGTNGRWQDVLSTDEVRLYEEKAAQLLTPDCLMWLEQGQAALGDAR
ncbi:MAG: sulfotransferase domain-containing protein [Caldilineaceae bacterium]